MKIALCQIDTTVGDLEGNARRVLAYARRAAAAGARLAMFPELSLSGYPPRDLLDRAEFIEAEGRAQAALCRDLGREAPALACLVGHLARNPRSDGKPLHNAASLFEGGAARFTWHKALLPTYDVFDEARWFEPGGCVGLAELDGRRLGVSVCEDFWNDQDFWRGRRLYRHDPVQRQLDAGAELLLNVSASPFHVGKQLLREQMLRRVAVDNRRPVALVNLVGGNDSLIFDGHSVVIDADGEIVARAPGFEEAMLVVDTAALTPGAAAVSAPGSEIAQLVEALTLGLRDYVHKCGFRSVVLGLSGGIDSAVTAAIAVRALGAGAVSGMAMPSPYSSQGSVDDALALARNLGIACPVVHIGAIYASYLETLAPVFEAQLDVRAPDLAMENVQARIRGALLMMRSNRDGSLLLTTGNKSELAMGYCTLYGDMCGGLAVISDVPKTWVYRVAEHLNAEAGRELIPRASIDKPPSAELRPNQTDQDSLPPYDLLDRILERYVDRSEGVDEIVAAGFDTGLDAELVRRIARTVDRSEYKRRQAAPGLRVTTKAFGEGRRLPIAQRFSRVKQPGNASS